MKRFIPTPVGNTVRQASGIGRFTVHPHACGEHDIDTVKDSDIKRFIPTPVGNTLPGTF
jgi:hypothetical protein